MRLRHPTALRPVAHLLELEHTLFSWTILSMLRAQILARLKARQQTASFEAFERASALQDSFSVTGSWKQCAGSWIKLSREHR